MNITVYCGSMSGNAPVYADAARDLGHWIGEQGHRLVYGGGGVGLMGVVSDAALEAGAEVIGIMPGFLVEREVSASDLTQLVVTETMAERKDKMIELGDAFVALPGGPGTIEEISEVMSLKKLGRVDGPCMLLSVGGYYDALAQAYDVQVERGFATPRERARLQVVSGVPELAELLS